VGIARLRARPRRRAFAVVESGPIVDGEGPHGGGQARERRGELVADGGRRAQRPYLWVAAAGEPAEAAPEAAHGQVNSGLGRVSE
jgi:hypothetical protein